MPIDSDVVPRLVSHSSFVHNRFMIGHDGKTPFSRIRGRNFDKEICEFGECIHFKIPKIIIGPDLNKWDDRWARGVVPGVRPMSNEFYIGTSKGIVKCRTIRRMIKEARWNVELINVVRGLPWASEWCRPGGVAS